MRNATNTMKKRKGFSLVELVIVILIIAVLATAVFAGGSAIVKKSQVSRTESDLHNFSVAIEAAMNETPSVANMYNDKGFDAILTAINGNLSDDYKLSELDKVKDTAYFDGVNGNIKVLDKTTSFAKDNGDEKAEAGENYVIYKSEKTDAWGNHYFALLDCGERHASGQSDFYVTVISAGPNAQTTIDGNIESDDIFLLVQYSDGDVVAATYDVDGDKLFTTQVGADGATETGPDYKLIVHEKDTVGSAAKTADGVAAVGAVHDLDTKATTIKGTAGYLMYQGGVNYTGYVDECLPVNF